MPLRTLTEMTAGGGRISDRKDVTVAPRAMPRVKIAQALMLAVASDAGRASVVRAARRRRS